MMNTKRTIGLGAVVALGWLLVGGIAARAEVAPTKKIGVALYGSNGHQIRPTKFERDANAELVAVAAVKGAVPAGVTRYETLDQILADPKVQLVSLCSPRRADQVRDAIRCLEAGRNVYAEKPSARTEAELDQILAAAKRSGKEFHEMAGTAFAPNYAAMRQLVRDGAVGDVVQVLVQKSYQYGETRPQDEAIDGGMFLQVGIHAVRLVEHVGGVRIKSITGWETRAGSPEKGEGKMAGAIQMTLENGGLATIILNYLNPPATKSHSYEALRVFGTKGFVESVDGGARTKLVNQAGVVEPLPKVGESFDYFDAVTKHLATGAAMPLTLDEELHPLRMLLQAKEKIRAAP